MSMYRPPLDDGMVIYATRYCLGRASYAVGECVEYLLAHWDKLQPKTQTVIVKDIEQAMHNGRVWALDQDVWVRVLERAGRE